MKRCVIGIILVIVIIGVTAVSGVFSVSALNANFINNLNWDRSYTFSGMLCCSSNSSYPFGVIQLDNQLIHVYGTNSSGSSRGTELCTFSISGGGKVLIGGAIDSYGATVLLTDFYAPSGGNSYYRLWAYRYTFPIGNQSGASSGATYVGLCYRDISSDNYQFVSFSDGFGFYSGYVGLSRDGKNFSRQFFYGLVSSHGIAKVDGGTWDDDDPANTPVGCLMPHVRGIIDTYNQKLYGVNNNGTLGIYSYYTGGMIYGGCTSQVSGTRYYYGVDPYSLSWFMYYFTLDGVMWIQNSMQAVPDFFLGGSIHQGTDSFPISSSFNGQYCFFWFSGSNVVYRFTVEYLPGSDPGNFFDFGGTPANINVTVSGIEVSYDDQWLRDHYSRQDAAASLEESRWQDYIDDISVTIPDVSQATSIINDLFDYSNDITIGQFGQGVLSSSGHSGLLLSLVILLGAGTLVAGIFL